MNILEYSSKILDQNNKMKASQTMANTKFDKKSKL